MANADSSFDIESGDMEPGSMESVIWSQWYGASVMESVVWSQ